MIYKETYTNINDIEKIINQSGSTKSQLLNLFMILLIGIMLGYGWRMHHEKNISIESTTINSILSK